MGKHLLKLPSQNPVQWKHESTRIVCLLMREAYTLYIYIKKTSKSFNVKTNRTLTVLKILQTKSAAKRTSL